MYIQDRKTLCGPAPEVVMSSLRFRHEYIGTPFQRLDGLLSSPLGPLLWAIYSHLGGLKSFYFIYGLRRYDRTLLPRSPPCVSVSVSFFSVLVRGPPLKVSLPSESIIPAASLLVSLPSPSPLATAWIAISHRVPPR